MRRARHGLLGGLGLAMLFLAVAGGLYLLYVDQVVRGKFEGKRWAVPARVFARPLEIYAGAPLSLEEFARELHWLGYLPVAEPRSSGTFNRTGNRVLVRTRGFEFWDGTEPERFIDVRFNENGLEQLQDAQKKTEIPLLRLDPPMIGSLYTTHAEDRVLLRRQEIPDTLIAALLAVEDRDFFQHHGLDPKAIARAMLANIMAGGLVQGGSTLTQQLVKNFFLTNERSLWRKINEASMALVLEWHYSKDEILEAYCNEIFLGQEGNRAIHGFGLASHWYFGRPLKELDLPRLALLVGLVKGPSYYEPRRHPDRAKSRRDLVIGVLLEQGLITKDQADRAIATPLGVTTQAGRANGAYPAFMDLVRRQLRRDYREEDLTSEGLRIFTTLDPQAQTQAEQTLARELPALERTKGKKINDLEGAAVVVSSSGGEVLALVGGRDPDYAGFNRALDAVRPIGSLVKPVVYLQALSQPQRYSLVTKLSDTPLRIKGSRGEAWSPNNYDRKPHGEIPLFSALSHSYNLATVRLGLDLGVKPVAESLQKLGATRPFEAYPSMLLGSVSLSPIEVAQIYQTIAAGGFRSPLRAIREIMDASGKALHRYPLQVDRVADSQGVYLLTWAMQEVVRSGTGKPLEKKLGAALRIAGKTGTTDELRDSWFAGFSGDKVAVAWVGRDDNQPAGLSGAQGAMVVWGEMMQRLHPLPLNPVMPEGVDFATVDLATGMLTDQHCETARRLPFIRGSVPRLAGNCGGETPEDTYYQRWSDQ